MPDRFPFYAFGNYLTGNGEILGSKIVFVLAEDKSAARALLVKELSSDGDVVPGSLRVCSASEIPVRWLLAAVMLSEGATWSSGEYARAPKSATQGERLN